MIGVCIVGCGVVGPTHMKSLKGLETARLAAVCDIIPARADKYAAEYSAAAYYDFDQVLTDDTIDAVHICTPHYLHVPMAVKALNAGKHVILEKPVCMNLRELKTLHDAAKNSSAHICVMLQNRTNSAIETMKKLYESDKSLGRLLGINGVMHWQRDKAYYDSEPWRGRWETEGGGAVINQSVHLLDLIDWFGRAKSIRAGISTKRLGDVIEVEDTADAYIELENSGCATFYATNNSPVNRPFEFELCFENAILRYSDNKLWRISGDSCEFVSKNEGVALGKSYWGSGHARVIHDFYQSITNNTNNYISLDDAMHSAELMCALYESAAENKTIVLGENKL